MSNEVQDLINQAAESIVRDAERYRWLKANADVVWYPPGYNGNPNCYWQVELLSSISQSLDAAVDAARSQGEPCEDAILPKDDAIRVCEHGTISGCVLCGARL